jgi:hypothetical protein
MGLSFGAVVVIDREVPTPMLAFSGLPGNAAKPSGIREKYWLYWLYSWSLWD